MYVCVSWVFVCDLGTISGVFLCVCVCYLMCVEMFVVVCMCGCVCWGVCACGTAP